MLTFHGCRVTRIPTVCLPGTEPPFAGEKGERRPLRPSSASSFLSLAPRSAGIAPTLACRGKKVHVQLNVESLILPSAGLPPCPVFIVLPGRLTASRYSVSYRSRTMSAIASVSVRLTHRVKRRGIRCRFRAARLVGPRRAPPPGIKGSLRASPENVNPALPALRRSGSPPPPQPSRPDFFPDSPARYRYVFLFPSVS